MEQTPKSLGYRFPAEWEQHEATWLTYPYQESSFFCDTNIIYPSYLEFIKQITRSEKLRINIPDLKFKTQFLRQVNENGIDSNQIEIFIHPSNDVWCRDHGPAFLINRQADKKKVIVNWEFNAWGDKYESNLDNQIPSLIAAHFQLPMFSPGINMEGGAVEFNGAGTLLTTKSVLLNENRNPNLSREKIEDYLCQYYCVDQILWIGDGVAGDDTDGHVDDLTRFVNSDTVITMVEENKKDENYQALKKNHEQLKAMRLLNGKQLTIVEVLMPSAIYCDTQRLPASYANFYYTNKAVIVPIFNCKYDNQAIYTLESVIKDRPIIGIDSRELVRGYGSFHCLSQQEPGV